jgi:hypothetical protein
VDNLEQKLDNVQRWCWEMAKSLIMILVGGTVLYIWWSCH